MSRFLRRSLDLWALLGDEGEHTVRHRWLTPGQADRDLTELALLAHGSDFSLFLLDWWFHSTWKANLTTNKQNLLGFRIWEEITNSKQMDSEETQREPFPLFLLANRRLGEMLLSQGCMNRKQPTGGLWKDFTAPNKERDKGLNTRKRAGFEKIYYGK